MNIIVTGAGNGLGREIVLALENNGHDVWEIDSEHGDDVRRGIDADRIPPVVDVLINCAGVNGIAWLSDVDDALWDKIMDTNVRGILKCTQSVLPKLRESKGTVVNIVSNAAHMPMRCSAAYNASKGAALILTKQMARELSDDDITVFSVSPNKLAGTKMSAQIDEEVCRTRGWGIEEARRYQIGSLLAKEETPPRVLAEFLAYLLQSKEHHKYLTGCDIPYGL